MAPYKWANDGYVDVFFHVEYDFTYKELMLFYGVAMEFKDCFREVKCKQGFTTRI